MLLWNFNAVYLKNARCLVYAILHPIYKMIQLIFSLMILLPELPVILDNFYQYHK